MLFFPVVFEYYCPHTTDSVFYWGCLWSTLVFCSSYSTSPNFFYSSKEISNLRMLDCWPMRLKNQLQYSALIIWGYTAWNRCARCPGCSNFATHSQFKERVPLQDSWAQCWGDTRCLSRTKRDPLFPIFLQALIDKCPKPSTSLTSKSLNSSVSIKLHTSVSKMSLPLIFLF